jgi:chromosome partitioning protein
VALDPDVHRAQIHLLEGFEMPTKIIAVCNQKGGVGKTTVVTNLAEVLSMMMGQRVLVIDADPQRNTTSALGIDEPEYSLNDVLYGDPANKHKVEAGVAADAVIMPGAAWQPNEAKSDVFPPIHLIASERLLASRERDTMIASERRLKTALKGAIDGYDVVLIDCPPSLGLLTISALTAATHVLLVTEPRVSSVEGLTEIVTTIGEVQENLNDDLEVIGVVVNKVRKNRADQEYWIERIRKDYGDLVLAPFIPDREQYAKAQAEARPLTSFGYAGRQTRLDMIELAGNVMKGADR